MTSLVVGNAFRFELYLDPGFDTRHGSVGNFSIKSKLIDSALVWWKISAAAGYHSAEINISEIILVQEYPLANVHVKRF